jgi:hypothetical protein
MVQEYQCNIKKSEYCNGLVAVMGKYLISAHLYSTACVFNHEFLAFDNMMRLMDGN